jgi:TfoX/Sxy family transcriptional regulator of competence genes
MAYNEELALRVSSILIQKNVDFIEKKMFGGLAFMINDKMCVGILKDELILRVMVEFSESLSEENYVRPMNFSRKIIKDMFFIEPEGFTTDVNLIKWIDYGLDFAERGVLKSKKKK